MKEIMKIAVFTMIFTGLSSSVIADHTVVDDLKCIRDSQEITTTWTVADPTEKYGGDLEVEAEFIAHCSDVSKSGNVALKIHLYQDKAETYSYSCVGSTNDGSECTGTAAVQDVEAVVAKAVTSAAKELCEEVGQSLVNTTGGEIETDVRIQVQHLQKGRKVRTQCNNSLKPPTPIQKT